MADYNKQRYYWIKITDHFMTSDTIDFLMSQKDGANYVVIYQMLCLKTINNNGQLSRQLGEIIIPYDDAKIQRDLKYFSIDTIRVALNLYKQLGLIYQQENGVLKIADFENIVGSQTISAEKKQSQRRLQSQNKSDGGGGQMSTPVSTPKVEFCPPDIDIDIEIEKVCMKENKNNINNNIIEEEYTRESYKDIMDDLYVDKAVRPAVWGFIKHCQLNNKTITNDKLANILIELDKQQLSTAQKIEALNTAVNKGFFDIKRE